MKPILDQECSAIKTLTAGLIAEKLSIPESSFSAVIKGIETGTYSELLEKICSTVDSRENLREDMKSIRRWHAYHLPLRNPDTNGLGHALNTLLLANQFTATDIKSGFITIDDRLKLLITAVIHDLGEINTGDVTYGAKTDAHELKEISAFNSNCRIFFPDLETNEFEELVKIYISIAMNKDFSLLLPRYFNMIEVTGYMNFGLEMFKLKPDDLNWEVLGWRILSYHLFRPGKDIPEHIKFSAAARNHWRCQLGDIDEMIRYYSELNQPEFLFTKYRRSCLPDYEKLSPINFTSWENIRSLILSE